MAKSKKPRKPKHDETREERISMEIVVDAHGEEERAMVWYCYLEDSLSFPVPLHQGATNLAPAGRGRGGGRRHGTGGRV